MNSNKQPIFFSLVIMILACSLYRVMPNRPFGFAPQLAMTIFGGALFVKDKKWAFALPILSMFISDVLYQVLFYYGLSSIQGFYKGQISNYALLASLTCIGFLVKSNKPLQIISASIVSPTLFFLASNLVVFIGGGGLNRPKTWEGLMLCYADGLPFYPVSIYSTVLFSALFFGAAFLFATYGRKESIETAS